MIMLLKKISSYFNKRNFDDVNRIHSVLAATLKNQRLKLHMTLKELTHGICSVSYGSKIENRLIVPDAHIMRLLFEKVNIDYDDLLTTKQNDELSICVKSYLYHQYEKIEEIYHNLRDKYFFARNSLVKILYYLSTRKFDDLLLEIKTLDNVKNTLSSYELLLLMILACEYNILTYKFKDAKKYLDLLANYEIKDQDLMILYHQQKFLVAFNLRDYQHIYDHYLKLKTLDYPLKNLFYINVLFLEAFIDNEKALETFNNMELDYVPEEYYEDYYYSKCLILIKLKRFIDVIKLIIDKKFLNVRFVGLFGYCLLMMKNMKRSVDEIKEYSKIFMDYFEKMEYDKYDSLNLGFVKLIKMEIEDESIDNIYEYIKKYLITESNNFHHRFYSYYYAYRYLQILGEKSRYKEAYLYMINNPQLVCHISDFD